MFPSHGFQPETRAEACPCSRNSPVCGGASGLALLLAVAMALTFLGRPPVVRAEQPPIAEPAEVELLSLQVPPRMPGFNQARAFRDLERQVAFGPRVPNSRGHTVTREYLIRELSGLADGVQRQNFRKRVRGRTLEMTNIIATWNMPVSTGLPSRPPLYTAPPGEPVLLAAHWDTRPTADREPDPRRRSRPIPGANDGASGVAVLLEIARGLKRMPPPGPVMMVLFDGEDYGPTAQDMFLGSRFFAAQLPRNVPRRGILLDMVGDADLEIPIERYSWDHARSVVVEVYTLAHRLGYGRHFPRRLGRYVLDDHVPLQRRGLEMIDLIDFHYGPRHSYWHTLHDTPDKCSPDSLRIVGEVVLSWVYSR
jgi:glutaminyl-peptide cyclotransferase